VTASILVVDDAREMQEILYHSLASEGFQVVTAGNGEDAVGRLEAQEFDVIVTDLVLPGCDGLEVLERARLLDPRAVVILMTGYASLGTAITALRRGANDYLEKPFPLDELTLRVRRLLQHRDVVGRERLQQRALNQRPTGHDLIGDSGAMRSVREQIARSALTRSNVLITGESGVGKELVARAVHEASARHDRAFLAVNCGAIPEALLESQLFGHVRGAFTTAVQANPGLFVAADGGTLFLDEIGELPFPLQVKLLRIIEERLVWPVGGTRAVPVDVRIIASTNRDLVAEVAAGRFRTDLFYRLNVLHVKVPPLRERRGDIPLLVDHLVGRLNVRLGTSFLAVEREALSRLINHPWPGNVRELENVLERAMVLGSGDLIAVQDLSADLPGPTHPRDLRGAVRWFERQHLEDVLAETADKRQAARVLGISLASLYRKLSPGAGPGK